MKIINIFLFVSLMFLLLNCNNSTSPTENLVLRKGTYSGTFSVTFKNYRNFSHSLTQTGTITVLFTDSAYTYLAIVNFSSDLTSTDSLRDNGTYYLAKNGIIMRDDSWWRMDAGWHNSLYLENTFNFDYNDIGLRISQDNAFANWNLNLVLGK